MHFSLVKLSTPLVPDTRCFDDAVIPLAHALRRLGYQAEIRVNDFNPHSRNICLGANYDPAQKWRSIPGDSIILNLEQLEATGYPWLKDGTYLKLLGAHETWDFSRRNLDFLGSKGISARFLPMGYVPEMTRLTPCPNPPWDVLFYGGMTPRRREIIDTLKEKGLRVQVLTQAYGLARDRALFSTKLLLNIHHSLPASLEVIRLGYVLANARAVVSEMAPETYHYPELARACAYAPHQELVDRVMELVNDPVKRENQAHQGFKDFAALRLDQALAELVGPRQGWSTGANFTRPRPDHLRIGSGLTFINSALNIDPDPQMKPDLVLDLTDHPIPTTSSFPTERFGEVTLESNSFETISLPNTLALTDRPDQLLATCLDLLKPDGQLIILVPYDLSAQAASFPRSFNENSWSSSISPFPAQDSSRAKFELAQINYILSDLGQILAAKGHDQAHLNMTPRAVDSIRVVLRKKVTPPEEWALARLTTDNSFYAGPAEVWQVAESPLDLPDQTPMPPLWQIPWLILGLKLKRFRYAQIIKRRIQGRHDRYKEKLTQVEQEIAKLEGFKKLAKNI